MEILVSFSILALSLGVLLGVFSSNVRLATVSEEYSKAVLLAESQLAEATAGKIEEGQNRGSLNEQFQWTVNISSYEPGFDDVEIDSLSVTPYQIEVKVEWGGDERPRAVTLTTLRLRVKS